MVGQKSKVRLERKKKKLAAYLEIAKLNEVDAVEKMKMIRLEAENVSASAEISSDTDGPSPKKIKEDQPLGKKYQKVNLPIEHVEKCDDGVVPELPNPNIDSPSLSIEELRKACRERANKLKKLPRFRLKEDGEMASLDKPEDQRIPLFMLDVQHLIMCSLLGHHAPFSAPRWYQLIKFNKLSHTTVLVVDDVSLEDLHFATGFLHLAPTQEDGSPVSVDSNPNKLFPWRLELVGPSMYGSNLIQEMATIPVSNTQYDKLIKRFGSIEEALKGKAIYKVFRAIFPVKEVEKEEESEGSTKDKDTFDEKEKEVENSNMDEKDQEKENEVKKNVKDKFPRTQLLLSANQMLEIGYPLPLKKCSSPDSAKQPVVIPTCEEKHAHSLGKLIQSPEFQKNLEEENVGEMQCEDADADKPPMDTNDEIDEELYVLSRPWYKEVGPDSPLFAVDCEMCMTGKQRFELTRISVVDEDLKVVYESYVKPYRKITNYLTRYSGITPKHLKDVKTRLIDVQRDLRKLFPPDAILVGQSLNFDLHAMKMMHPYVIDSSIIFNLTGQRLKRSKLATLSRLFLSEEIQCWGSKGHDSIEDAAAAMKLVLLKLSKNISYGDAVLEGQLPRKGKGKGKREPRQVRLTNDLGRGTMGESYATSIFSHVKRGQHTAVVVGVKDVIAEYQDYVEECLSSKNKQRVDKTSTEERTCKLVPVEHAKEVITRACEVMLEHQLCIIHLTRDSVGEKLIKLEKWCKKIVKHAAANSLCIVVLGGAQSANGVCLIHLKQAVDASL